MTTVQLHPVPPGRRVPLRGQRGHAEALPLGAAPLLPLARHRLGPPRRHGALAVTTRARLLLFLCLLLFRS